MFTDIVGYTALMGEDEQKALEMIRSYEQTVHGLTSEHRGEVINFYGDGSLAIFREAKASLLCAAAIQRAFNSADYVPLRIGVHKGDVIFENSNVYGDPVNIASRIESLGQAGAVMLSEEVRSHILEHRDLETQLIGSFEFKNVPKAMNIYALSSFGLHVPEKESITGKLKSGSAEQNQRSIVVMPFSNLSSDNKTDYLADGIADEIRSQLLTIEGLKVISRSSSMRYKGKDYDSRQLLDELKVKYVLEGRVQFHADKLKLHVELSSTKTDKQIWAYSSQEIALDRIFNLQNEVASDVATELRIITSEAEKQAIQKVATQNAEAMKAYQQGMALLHRGYGKVEELTEALKCFETAVELDPEFSKAVVGIADAHLEHMFWGRRPPKEALELAEQAAKLALAIDETNLEALASLGAIYFFKHQSKQKAKEYLQKVMEQMPSHIGSYEKMAWIYLAEQNFEESKRMFLKVQELDPLSSKYMGDLGHVYYYSNQSKEGVAYLESKLKEYPDDSWLQWMCAFLLAGAGEYTKASEMLSSRATSGKRSNWMLGYVYGMLGRKEEAEVILNFHLSKRQLDYVPAYMIATIYMGLKDHEKALDWLEQDLEDGGQGLFFVNLGCDPKFSVLKNHPRFKQLLKVLDF